MALSFTLLLPMLLRRGGVYCGEGSNVDVSASTSEGNSAYWGVMQLRS